MKINKMSLFKIAAVLLYLLFFLLILIRNGMLVSSSGTKTTGYVKLIS